MKASKHKILHGRYEWSRAGEQTCPVELLTERSLQTEKQETTSNLHQMPLEKWKFLNSRTIPEKKIKVAQQILQIGEQMEKKNVTDASFSDEKARKHQQKLAQSQKPTTQRKYAKHCNKEITRNWQDSCCAMPNNTTFPTEKNTTGKKCLPALCSTNHSHIDSVYLFIFYL